MDLEKWFVEGISAQGVAMISAILSAVLMVVWNVTRRVVARLTRPDELVARALALLEYPEDWVYEPCDYRYTHKSKVCSFSNDLSWFSVNRNGLIHHSGWMDRARLKKKMRQVMKYLARKALSEGFDEVATKS